MIKDVYILLNVDEYFIQSTIGRSAPQQTRKKWVI